MRLLVIGLAVAGALFLCPSVLASNAPKAADLESELVCPVCETTLDQSNAPIAQHMKAFIRRRIAAGDSAQEIKDTLVSQLGPGVLAKPPSGGFGMLAWLLPLAVLLAGALVVTLLVRSWSRRRAPPEEAAPLDPRLERLVDDELARFDG